MLKVDVKLETNLDSHAAIADALDRAKWGLSQAAECDFALGENPVVIREIDGTRVPTLRRSSRNPDLSSPVLNRPLADTVSGASDAVHQFQRAAQAVRGLERALWLFGRANNASLPRDSVLDAVIGLESLLVASPGETTYKFALHGTAVLTHYADDVHQELKRLYGLRSKAAHSGASEDFKFTENAPRARQLLAQALYRVAILINGNMLKFEKPDASVGQAVEKWVRDIVIEHASVTQSAVQTEKDS